MKHIPDLNRTVLRSPIHLLAFGFGSGLSPKAPGTMGTLMAMPLYLLLAGLPVVGYGLAVLVISVVGIWLCGESSRRLGVHDHGGIVWDEFAGFFVTMMPVQAGLVVMAGSWWWLLAGFLLFRLFDIWKPWPISIADKRVEGGWGIMLDDLIAGVYAAVCLLLLSVVITVV